MSSPSTANLINARALAAVTDAVVVDCRFVLGQPAAGYEDYLRGHIPGAHYLHLERDLSGPVGPHGGRHPLPAAQQLVAKLASLGIAPGTRVVAYDASRFAFAARFWWLLRSLGYRPPELLDGGYAAWLAAGGTSEQCVPQPQPCAVPTVEGYTGVVDIAGLGAMQAASSVLLDSRDPARFAGLEEPLDPVAGHIPGALNMPWQAVSDARGFLLDDRQLAQHFAALPEGAPRVVYCGSGVTACVNLFALARTGDEHALLYAGSWSDWCSYLPAG